MFGTRLLPSSITSLVNHLRYGSSYGKHLAHVIDHSRMNLEDMEEVSQRHRGRVWTNFKENICLFQVYQVSASIALLHPS